MNTCRACGAPVKWIKTKNGKAMPCNPEKIAFLPEKSGDKVFILENGEVTKGSTDGMSTHEGYISHFATCPAADEFRRKR